MSVAEPRIEPAPLTSTWSDTALAYAAPPRLSLWRWLLLMSVRPVKAVRGSDHFGWLGSWAVHLLGLLLGVVVIVILPELIGGTYREGPSDLLIEMSVATDEIIEAALQDATNVVLALAGAISGLLMIHAGTAVSAIALMCWTARGDERVRASWGRAMQRLWRLTPFAVVMVVVLSIGTFLVEVTAMAWGDWAYWEVEMYLWSGAWLVSMAWPIVVTLWALHPGPTRPRCRWPALCGSCGYTLLALDERQTCPECGLTVAESTEPSRRPGVAWGDWHESTLLTAWARNAGQAIFQPTRLGQSLHLLAPDERHRHRFVLQLAAAVLSPIPGMLAVIAVLVWIVGEPLAADDFLSVVPLMILLLGTWTMAAMAGVQIGGAGVVGGLASWRMGRNMLPAARQAMVCLGGYMLLWVAVIWLYGLAAMMLFHYLDQSSVGMSQSLHWAWIVWLAFLALNAFFGAGYPGLLWRIVRGARYANW